MNKSSTTGDVIPNVRNVVPHNHPLAHGSAPQSLGVSVAVTANASQRASALNLQGQLNLQ